MAEDSFNDGGSRVLFMDLENCLSQIHKLMNNLEQYSHVVVCYAQSGVKIPIDWIVPLTTTIDLNWLKCHKVVRMLPTLELLFGRGSITSSNTF